MAFTNIEKAGWALNDALSGLEKAFEEKISKLEEELKEAHDLITELQQQLEGN